MKNEKTIERSAGYLGNQFNKNVKVAMIDMKEDELYKEIEIFVDDQKIGEAEVDLKNKMLSRLLIFEPYQDNGYGMQIVKMLTEEYGLNNLHV